MAKMDNIKFLSDIDAPSITVNGEHVATKPYVDNKVANIPTKTSQLTNDSGFITSSSESVESGYQLTATGEYSAAFNKGLIGSETKASILGYEIDVSDILTKGVDIVAVDTVNNILDIYGTYEVKVLGFTVYTLTIADAFEYALGADPKFIVEVANTHKLPVISSEKVTVSGKEHARLHIHKSASVSDITTSQKVTNFYAGYVDARNSMVVNNLNVVLGEHSFASGSNNLNIGHSTHTQNTNNIASGEGGSAAGRQTEAGVSAFSTGYLTKALGESSFTFGLRSETAYTESTEIEGGKGSIAGGYQAKANAPYSAAFGDSTHADRYAQFVCGLNNKEDTNALFIVGQGNNRNAFTVDTTGKGTLLNLKVGNDAAEVTGGNGTLGVGNRTKTRGESSFTFGIGSETAETTYGDGATEGGKGSIAGGYESMANASYSAALGFMNTSDAKGQLACGQLNAPDANAMFVVGIGTSETTRTNGFTVDKDGVGRFASTVYSAGKKLATQEWVNEQLNILANTLKKLNDGGIE